MPSLLKPYILQAKIPTVQNISCFLPNLTYSFIFFIRFTVYIVIPMHPEGVATDSAIQEMLFWQKHTMHMMYARVAQAIHSAGKNFHPTEYLMFFCLGKKEAIEDIPAQLAKPPRFSGMPLNSFRSKN